jgi:hypothetical protein
MATDKGNVFAVNMLTGVTPVGKKIFVVRQGTGLFLFCRAPGKMRTAGKNFLCGALEKMGTAKTGTHDKASFSHSVTLQYIYVYW